MNIFKNISIIAPHPDDEVLGCGGTIKRLINIGCKVRILFVSGHLPPIYTEKAFLKTQNESYKALNFLGVKNKDIEFLKIPATTISKTPVSVLNKEIENFIFKEKTDTVFSCFPDRHIDHKLIFEATMVATRPNKKDFPTKVLLYETLSETHWNVGNIEPNFVPNFFINISNTIKSKAKALSYYKSQIKKDSPRSIEAIKALAKFRGSQNGCNYAEAYQLVRAIY